MERKYRNNRNYINLGNVRSSVLITCKRLQLQNEDTYIHAYTRIYMSIKIALFIVEEFSISCLLVLISYKHMPLYINQLNLGLV